MNSNSVRYLTPLCQSLMIALAVALSSLLSGCGGGGGGDKAQRSGNSYHLRSSTKTLLPNTGVTLVDQDDTSMTLSGTVPSFKPGDVIASALGHKAIRKVVSVSTVGGNTILQTQQAALSDAFDRLDIDWKGFGKDQVGDIQSNTPGLTYTWVSDAKARSKIASARATPSAEFKTLQLQFGHVSFGPGVEVTGTLHLHFNPLFHVHLDDSNGNGSADIGISPEVDGELEVSTSDTATTISGQIEGKSIELPSIPIEGIPFLEITPTLTPSASISGTVKRVFTSTFSLDAGASAVASYRQGKGWTNKAEKHFDVTPSVTSCKDAASLNIRTFQISLALDINDVGGPEANVFSSINVVGQHTVRPDKSEGTEVVVTSGLGGGASLFTLSPKFKELLGGNVTVGELSWDIPLREFLPHFFFPSHSDGTIHVEDDGPDYDDIFNVSVDGRSQGSTPQGGGADFPINDLTTGSHVLNLTCNLDGTNGGGGYRVTLSGGLSFEDGSTVVEGVIDQGQSDNLTFIVSESKSMATGVSKVVRLSSKSHKQAGSRP